MPAAKKRRGWSSKVEAIRMKWMLQWEKNQNGSLFLWGRKYVYRSARMCVYCMYMSMFLMYMYVPVLVCVPCTHGCREMYTYVYILCLDATTHICLYIYV